MAATNDDIVSALQSLTNQLRRIEDFQKGQIDRQSAAPPGAIRPSGIIVTNASGAPIAGPLTGAQQATEPSLPPPPGREPTFRPPAVPASTPSGMPVPNLATTSSTSTLSDLWARRNILKQSPLYQGRFPLAGALAEYSQQSQQDQQSQADAQAANKQAEINGQGQGGFQAPWGSNATDRAVANALNSGNGMGTHGPGGKFGFSSQDALTMAMLGEHGAPSFLRNIAMTSYGLQQSLGWAQKAATSVQGSNWAPGVVKGAMGPLQGALNLAVNNPLATYMGVQALHTITGTIGAINDHAQTAQAIGESFGMASGQPFGPRYFAGFRNPLSDVGGAAGVGYAFDALKQQLEGRVPGGGFGAGLSGKQATAALDVIANSGFSDNAQQLSHPFTTSGNATTIAQGLFRPVMNATPGLGAQEIGQFLDSLRNAGASVDTVRNQLLQFGTDAHATSMNVRQFASEVKSASTSIQGLGSSSQGATNLALGFQGTTGIQGAPEMAAQLANNSMVQGMAVGQYGVLPSAIGDMNPGAFGQSAASTVEMLNRALTGIDHNVYRRQWGMNVLESSGAQARTDQIAKMLGLPSNQVKALLGETGSGRFQARNNIQNFIGSEGAQGTGGTGLWALAQQNYGHLNAHQMHQFNQEWNVMGQHLAGTGITHKQFEAISHKYSSPEQRLNAMTHLMNASQSNQGLNTVQKQNGPQVVKVEFTGAAAKYFQALNTKPTIARNQANAGKIAYNHVINSPGGDPQFDVRFGIMNTHGR